MANKKYAFFHHVDTFQHYLAPGRFKFETRGKQATELVDEYIAHPEEFIRTFTVVINGKRRNIITYQPNEKGAKLRNLQRLFVCVLRGLHQPSEHSYAYKEGSSTKACLEQHLTNDHFLKTDIHAYFDSVSFELLREKVFALISGVRRKRDYLLKEKESASESNMRRQHAYWTKILSACFYEGKMPIGFVSSPMLSDIFLKDVDERFGNMEGISYTRYADDFIISSSGDEAENHLQYLLEELNREMEARKLELNKKKTYFRHLRQEGDAIHVLGLNLVRTARETNRITVSDRFIRETSMELCQLMQEKTQLNDWEARKRFCSAMGKVGYITYASEQSARKLQKMLRVKTGREISLDYKSLQQACMMNPAANAEYQQTQYYAAYAKAIEFSCLPDEGLVWERASVRAATEKEMQALTRKEKNREDLHLFSVALRQLLEEVRADEEKGNKPHASLRNRKCPKTEDILTVQERREANKREHSLGSLKYYIMGLCRAAERNLQIRNVRLTIGDETVIAKSNSDVQALRQQARKFRDTKDAVSFYAHYQYANPEEGKCRKCGKIHITDGSYRPLLGMAGGVSCTMDSCVVSNTEGTIWKLADQDGRQDARALTDCHVSALMTEENWQGDIQLDAYWPLAADELSQVQIRSLLAQLPFDTAADIDCRTAHADEKLQLNAEQAVSMVNTLRELSAVIKQVDGELQLECTLFPAGYLESIEEKPLRFIEISIGKSGIVSLKNGIF